MAVNDELVGAKAESASFEVMWSVLSRPESL